MSNRAPFLILLFAAYVRISQAAPQTQASTAVPPVFEVASVKVSTPAARPSIRRDPAGGLTALGIDLKTLVLLAYQVQGFQLTGAPGWMSSDRWDVVAKAPAASKKDLTWMMLRSLLEDRFKLAVHRESKDLPIYNLVISKDGPKFHEIQREPNEADGSFRVTPGQLTTQRFSIEGLAFALGDVMGHRVVDQTGIKGNFDLKLDWTPEKRQTAADTAPLDPDAVTIFAALQDQLGLKLEASKGPVGILVIDRVEKATEN